MVKIQENTKILTDCLAETKVSNVVKENNSLLSDHNKVKKKIGKINENLAKEMMNYESSVFQNGNQQQRKLRQSINSIRESITCDYDTHPTRLEDRNLSSMVRELEKLVDATLTRLTLVQEECSHFKTQCQDTAHSYQRIKSQYQLLSSRVNQQIESTDKLSPDAVNLQDQKVASCKKFSLGNASIVASQNSLKNQGSGSINVNKNCENQFSANSTKTNETGSAGLKTVNNKPTLIAPESSKKLTYEENVTLPTEKGLSAHKHIVTDKASQELFGKSILAQGRSPRGTQPAENMFEFPTNAIGFDELRLSVIPQAIEADNREPDDFLSPDRGREVLVDKEDCLTGQFSTIKQNSRRQVPLGQLKKPDDQDQFDDPRLDQSPFFEAIDDL